MQRILVLKGGALGDFVVTLPALALLRTRWPQARIELVGNARAARCAVGRHYLDAAHSQHEARWSRLGSGTLAIGEPLGDWLASFDLVVHFWPDADGAITADLARLGFRTHGTPTLIVGDAHPACTPASAHFCTALSSLGLRPAHVAPVLFPSAEDRATAKALLAPDVPGRLLIAWHPGSGSPRKNWTPENWLAVIHTLAARVPLRVVVILGEIERAWWDAAGLATHLPPGSVVLRDTPPEVLTGVFTQCALLLGHDSGPAHLAAAAGCPCVLVFGPTDPAMWAPPHAHVRAVQNGGDITSVRVDDVLAAIPPLTQPIAPR